MKRIIAFISKAYLKKEYKPEDIPATIAKQRVPKRFHLKGVPWISYKKAYCESACLQMIARSVGIEENVNYFNFLMGFTYTFSYLRSAKLAIPTSDPTPGLRFAAPFLDLKMRYLVTNSRELFVKALKHYLSKGHPVRVQVNANKLYGKEGFGPHGVLAVGYDGDTFFYFEPGCEDKWVENGGKGIDISTERLAEAVLDLSKNSGYPWKYSLTIFEKAKGEKNLNLSKVFERNGKMLIGGGFWFAFEGSRALEVFAKDLEKILEEAGGRDWISEILKLAVYSRIGNAKFLKKRFSNIGGAVRAASHLEKASKLYSEVLKEVKSSSGEVSVEKAVKHLNRIADLERKAGEALLKAAEEYAGS